MRIEKLVLRNYRQLRDVQLALDRQGPNDLHIVIGRNGTGKTNILNAINWCLYGDEPHLSKHSEQLPRLNLGCIEDAGHGGHDLQVAVEVWVKTEDGGTLIFERTETYRIGGDDKEPLRQDTHFEARVTDDKGNTKILVDDEASYCAERFVPQSIREFFFFDGERLDRYFKEATSQHIRHAVFELSQIHVLQSVEANLDTVLKDLRKDAGKANPAIEEVGDALEATEAKLAELDRQIEMCAQQKSLAEDKIAEYQEQLRGAPDAGALEEERRSLDTRNKEKRKRLEESVREKHELLFDHAIRIQVWDAIAESLSTIDEKRQKNEIPPTVDTALLEAVLQDGSCSVCGRALDESSVKHVGAVLDEIRLTSDIAKQLLNMENPLRRHAEKLGRFRGEMTKAAREIGDYEADLAAMERRKREIDAALDGYDVLRIAEWHKERSKFEETRDTNQKQLGALEARRQILTRELGELQNRLDEQLKKEAKVAELRAQISFCARALETIRGTKQAIMRDTREEIESETRRLFFALAWKSATFGDVRIDENFNISLIHSMGYECLGTASAAERELLALSFTLALHRVSGFDSPILIDTPVARVSDSHRVSFGQVLLQVSAEKQTVLLLTPAEHSDDLAQVVDARSSNRLALKLSADEREVRVEVL
jgi:DNA sulfur modification protein DndD